MASFSATGCRRTTGTKGCSEATGKPSRVVDRSDHNNGDSRGRQVSGINHRRRLWEFGDLSKTDSSELKDQNKILMDRIVGCSMTLHKA